jgi:tetratricopeptide (TPR) repeat protein
LNGVLFDVKLQKMTVSDPRAATDLETGLTLAKLIALLRRRDEARSRYGELAKAYPDNWEIYEGLAHLYWREGDNAQAKENFRRAVNLNPPSWKTYWDYARFAHGDEGTVEALRNALKLNPELGEARLMLGFELYNARQFQQAYDVLAEIKQVTPDRAPHFFLMKAFSALEIGKKPEARGAAESAKKYARTPDETIQANRLIDYLDNKPAATELAAAPIQQRRQPSGEGEPVTIQPLPDLPHIRGTLQEIECLGREARVKVLVDNTRVSLLIRDPRAVHLRNSDESSVNLTCGPQQGSEVVVGYRERQDVRFKTTGDVVTLEFLKRASKP